MNDLVLRRLKSPSGFIASAKTYSIYFSGGNVYILLIGKAMNDLPSTGNVLSQKLAEGMVNKMANNLALKLNAKELEYSKISLDEAANLKGNYKFSKEELTDISFDQPAHAPKLSIRAAGKKFRFEPNGVDPNTILAFVKSVKGL